MKTEIALAVASVGMALSVAFPFPAQAGEIEDRFVYVGCGLGNREKVDKTIDVVRRAAKLGFNGLVLQGDIQYAWMAPEHERKNLARLKAACDEAAEIALDMAESALLRNIQAGDTKAIKFYLMCKGKSRGYDPRQEIDINATVVRPRVVFEEDENDGSVQD